MCVAIETKIRGNRGEVIIVVRCFRIKKQVVGTGLLDCNVHFFLKYLFILSPLSATIFTVDGGAPKKKLMET